MTAKKAGQKGAVPQRLQVWVEARRRHGLSHAHVQMARELGLNPKKLGKLDNHRQEPWKAPLPQFIEHLYLKRFGWARPDVCRSVASKIRNSRRPSRQTRRSHGEY